VIFMVTLGTPAAPAHHCFLGWSASKLRVARKHSTTERRGTTALHHHHGAPWWSAVLSGNACYGARHDATAHATAHATARGRPSEETVFALRVGSKMSWGTDF
jgi:hypothetical protein